ncbi:TPA: hypothetical protein ACH3X1_014335 [Trebouxia sp. C0004]
MCRTQASYLWDIVNKDCKTQEVKLADGRSCAVFVARQQRPSPTATAVQSALGRVSVAASATLSWGKAQLAQPPATLEPSNVGLGHSGAAIVADGTAQPAAANAATLPLLPSKRNGQGGLLALPTLKRVRMLTPSPRQTDTSSDSLSLSKQSSDTQLLIESQSDASEVEHVSSSEVLSHLHGPPTAIASQLQLQQPQQQQSRRRVFVAPRPSRAAAANAMAHIHAQQHRLPPPPPPAPLPSVPKGLFIERSKRAAAYKATIAIHQQQHNLLPIVSAAAAAVSKQLDSRGRSSTAAACSVSMASSKMTLKSLEPFVSSSGDLLGSNQLCVSTLVDQAEKDKLIQLLERAVRDGIRGKGKLTFPQGFYCIPSMEQTADAFSALRAFDALSLLAPCARSLGQSYATKSKPLKLITQLSPQQMRNFNSASDCFQIHERLRVSTNRSPSPYQVWTIPKYRQLWLLNLQKYYIGNPAYLQLTTALLRRAFQARFPYATQFPTAAAKCVYQFLKSRKVLDPCYGWGDRFAAAMTSSRVQQFVGIDPRAAAKRGFQQQVACYQQLLPANSPVNSGNVQFILGMAESVKLPDLKFDTIFTSPPYFDREEYDMENSTQSSHRYPAVEHWLEKFLFKLCTRMWGLLEDKGHLAINIVDRPPLQLCDAMNAHISTLPCAKFKGVLQLQTAQRPQTAAREGKLIKFEPIWVWQRVM